MNNQYPIIDRAFEWLALERGESFLTWDEHCPTRDVFQARLDSLRLTMERDATLQDVYPLIIAVLGELGNNAFDHNLGSWRDEPGVYFVYDLSQRFATIADRGQGVLASLRRALPELATEQAAVETAFTQTISGRIPEQRGNGLKFVASVVRDAGFSLEFYSGDGSYTIGRDEPSQRIDQPLKGVLARLQF